MAGKKVIITGVPGVGKTSVIDGTIKKLGEEGIVYTNLNFGSFMFEVAQKENIAKDRDQMRTLGKDTQKRLQKLASQAIAKIDGNIIIDTHASVKTGTGFLPGLPLWVIQELMPDIIILVETDPDQILKRRFSDVTRTRDIEGFRDIDDHQRFNRSVAASYAMISGCTVKYITNADFLLEQAVSELVKILR
jgi:adenylate kinase